MQIWQYMLYTCTVCHVVDAVHEGSPLLINQEHSLAVMDLQGLPIVSRQRWSLEESRSANCHVSSLVNVPRLSLNRDKSCSD